MFLLLPLLSIGRAPLVNVLTDIAFAIVLIALCLYLPYRAGSLLGYQQYEDDEAA